MNSNPPERTLGRRKRVFRQCLLAVFLVAVQSLSTTTGAAAEVSFRNDVMAVLSKAGCNMGVCHGNKHGKGGFKLSLRGQDPDFDYDALCRSQSARRLNLLNPTLSLALLKPTMQVAHEGGRRFAVGSLGYQLVRRWIAEGMPRDGANVPWLTGLVVTPADTILTDPIDRIQLHVVAEFSDGGRRDVTNLAVYEAASPLVDIKPDGLIQRRKLGETTVSVRFLNRQLSIRVAFIPARPDFVWSGPTPSNFIDEHVFTKLRRLRMNPSDVCDDTVFLRRAYLDLLGLLPTAREARQFLRDRRADKRARLIDELLQRPEFADFWAQKWSDLLRNEEKTLDRKGVQHFYAWIRHGIARGKPLDQFVRELVASRGSTYSNPASNYYRAMRDPLMRAESTAQLFLGVRLQCAKCHNHPFDRWTQNDYYSWANLFARVDYEVLENRRRDRNDKHEFDGEQIVYMKREGDVTHPGLGKSVAPRFLGAQPATVSSRADRLEQLADWLVNPNNKRFAQSQANRIWFNLMGRGIVDPIDDFRSTNLPANPRLLDALSDELVGNKFDLRHLIRVIMNSQVYQLSIVPNESNRDDETNFSHAIVRRLSAEQMADAISQVTGAAIEFNGYPAGMRAGQLPGVRAVRLRDQSPSQGDRFLKLFGKPPRLQSCECERTEATTLNQAFELVSGPLVNELLTRPDNRLSQLLKSGRPNYEIVEELYWTALSRPPSNSERIAAIRILEVGEDQRLALEDITWCLVNSIAFVFRR